MTEATGRTTRAQRMAMPLAREVVKDLAVEHGACIRPIQLRRTNLDTGEVDTVLVPCGHTLAHVCPSCAERARTLRAAQCREGWHLEDEPLSRPVEAAISDEVPGTREQLGWLGLRGLQFDAPTGAVGIYRFHERGDGVAPRFKRRCFGETRFAE